MLSTEKPFALVGTRKALMPPALRSAFAGSVMAKTMHQSAGGLLVVQSFRPVMRQPLSVLTARVFSMLASEPAPGSERPKHIDVSPDIMPARQRFDASGVTWVSTRLGPNAQCEMTHGVRMVCEPSRRLIASQAT